MKHVYQMECHELYVLTNCAEEFASSLVTLFNLGIEESRVPTSWKLANVLPVYDKSDNDHVSKYRPVSLLSTVSGVMENCIYNHAGMITNNMICFEQHGFLKGKSCNTQPADVIHESGSYLDN